MYALVYSYVLSSTRLLSITEIYSYEEKKSNRKEQFKINSQAKMDKE